MLFRNTAPFRITILKISFKLCKECVSTAKPFSFLREGFLMCSQLFAACLLISFILPELGGGEPCEPQEFADKMRAVVKSAVEAYVHNAVGGVEQSA